MMGSDLSMYRMKYLRILQVYGKISSSKGSWIKHRTSRKFMLLSTNEIWALSDKTQMIVYEINSTTMKFRVSNPVTRNRIIKRARWKIAEIPVVMAMWSLLTEDIKQETHSIPLWVHLRNVLMDMFSWNGLSFVSSPVGTPVRLHPETEQCLNLKIAKIFVKMDISKEVPKSINFTIKGKETLV